MSAEYDLHTHSNASDGLIPPAELVSRADALGIRHLALTDHDTVSGLTEAQHAAIGKQISIINGIELSTRWQNQTIHVVGLNVNKDHDELINVTSRLDSMRDKRAKKIGDKLARAGIEHTYAKAKQLAGSGTVTRQHFAHVLVDMGVAKTTNDVFKRYLVRNKPGYVNADWPMLNETLYLIHSAGGVAVIAHPLRYKMTATKLRQLMTEFKQLGGLGIEVVTGSHSRDEISLVANYAKQYELAASVGSDFHNLDTAWAQLGNLASLPDNLTPIWQVW